MEGDWGVLVSDADIARVTKRLLADLFRTVGAGHESVVEETAERLRECCRASDFEDRLVADVQQYLHDTFVDTTWPRCPEHPHHPLWYEAGWWSCTQSGTKVARLGALSAKRGEPSGRG